MIGRHLAGAADELLTRVTVVTEKRLVALDAVRFLLPQDVLLSVQGLLTLCAVVALTHRDSYLLCESKEKQISHMVR